MTKSQLDKEIAKAQAKYRELMVLLKNVELKIKALMTRRFKNG